MKRLILVLAFGIVAGGLVGLAPASPKSVPPFARCLHQAGGGSLALEACDPVALARAYRDHTLTDLGPLRITVRDRHWPTPHRSGSNPGMVQVVGQPLTSGASIIFAGRPTSRMDVNIGAMKLGTNGQFTRLVSILVAPRDVKMLRRLAVWRLDWSAESKLPTLHEVSPHSRTIPFRTLSLR